MTPTATAGPRWPGKLPAWTITGFCSGAVLTGMFVWGTIYQSTPLQRFYLKPYLKAVAAAPLDNLSSRQ
jgi:hypothetical protein